MRIADAEALGKEFFVAETLDPGFRNVDVFRTLQKVMATERGVKGMEGVFRKHLTVEGQVYAKRFCDIWISGGMWAWIAYTAERMQKGDL